MDRGDYGMSEGERYEAYADPEPLGDLMLVPDGSGTAGIVIWWELAGPVAIEDLREALEAEGFGASHMPESPSTMTALWRAAQAAAAGSRQMVRPLSRRGSWEIVFEKVVVDEESFEEHLEHRAVVRGWVTRVDGAEKASVKSLDDEIGRGIAELIASSVPRYESVLAPSDVSSWLLDLASGREVQSVSLRQRGGFYFVPQGSVEIWRRIVRAVRAASSHWFGEIPAMRTDEAVEAILRSLRREAETAFGELEQYLAEGETSTRGLNSSERKLDALRAKIQSYAELFEREQPDLLDEAERYLGAVAAARVVEVGE